MLFFHPLSFLSQQEGSLCAQHCLNALLQGPYFTAVDLAELGRQVDETERQQIAEAGLQSQEYRRFLEVISNIFTHFWSYFLDLCTKGSCDIFITCDV